MNAFGHLPSASPLRRLKWLSTFIASVAAIIALGIVMHWAFGGDNYHWSTLPVALGVTAVAFTARHAIALKLGDNRAQLTK